MKIVMTFVNKDNWPFTSEVLRKCDLRIIWSICNLLSDQKNGNDQENYTEGRFTIHIDWLNDRVTGLTNSILGITRKARWVSYKSRRRLPTANYSSTCSHSGASNSHSAARSSLSLIDFPRPWSGILSAIIMSISIRSRVCRAWYRFDAASARSPCSDNISICCADIFGHNG